MFESETKNSEVLRDISKFYFCLKNALLTEKQRLIKNTVMLLLIESNKIEIFKIYKKKHPLCLVKTRTSSCTIFTVLKTIPCKPWNKN